MTLTIEAIPDRLPEIAFTVPPEVNARGTFTLSYKGKDDYGIASLEGIVEKADNSKGRSLVPAPQLTLAHSEPRGERAGHQVSGRSHRTMPGPARR